MRAGRNTLAPYDENPPNLTVGEDDIVFLDLGPVFEEWEADFRRTYVVGNDPLKHKLCRDISTLPQEALDEINRIQTRQRLNKVVKIGVPGFIPQGRST